MAREAVTHYQEATAKPCWSGFASAPLAPYSVELFHIFTEDFIMGKPCKEHTLSPDRQGYARTSFEGQLTGLHRKVYCQTRGLHLESIKGLVVRHACDNSRCIEPTHLLLGTSADNNRDRASRGRSADRHGEAHPRRVLSEPQVLEIRRLHSEGSLNQFQLAERYGCTQSNISRIVNLHAWRKS